MSSIYSINKGVGKSIEFRGLKAQYIWYFAGGVLLLMMLFGILYILRVNTFICLGLILALGAGLLHTLYRWSARYGQYGMMKKIASARTPKIIKSRSRGTFQKLTNHGHHR